MERELKPSTCTGAQAWQPQQLPYKQTVFLKTTKTAMPTGRYSDSFSYTTTTQCIYIYIDPPLIALFQDKF